MNVLKTMYQIGKSTVKNKELLLMGSATTLQLVSTGLAVFNGHKVLDDILEAKDCIEAGEKLDKSRFAGDLLFHAGPIILTTGLSIRNYWKARSMNLTAIAELAAAGMVLADNSDSFKAATKKVVGEEALNKIEDQAVRDRIPVKSETRRIVDTGYGDQLYMEAETRQFFRASPKFIDDVYADIRKGFFDSKGYVPIKNHECHNAILRGLGLEEIEAYDSIGYSYERLPYPVITFPEESPEECKAKYGEEFHVLRTNPSPRFLPQNWERDN